MNATTAGSYTYNAMYIHYTFLYLAFNNNSVAIQGRPSYDQLGTTNEAITFFRYQLSVGVVNFLVSMGVAKEAPTELLPPVRG